MTTILKRNMPDDYGFHFNSFIAQNCNLKSSVITQFHKLKEDFENKRRDIKQYMTVITCEYEDKGYRQNPKK